MIFLTIGFALLILILGLGYLIYREVAASKKARREAETYLQKYD